MDEGNSLLIAVDSQVSNEQRQLIADFGVDLEPAGHVVTDHFHRAAVGHSHAAITAHTYVPSRGVWGESQPQVRMMQALCRCNALLYMLWCGIGADHELRTLTHGLLCVQAPVLFSGIGMSISPESKLVSNLPARALFQVTRPCMVDTSWARE